MYKCLQNEAVKQIELNWRIIWGKEESKSNTFFYIMNIHLFLKLGLGGGSLLVNLTVTPTKHFIWIENSPTTIKKICNTECFLIFDPVEWRKSLFLLNYNSGF